jgi:hypothetical protein
MPETKTERTSPITYSRKQAVDNYLSRVPVEQVEVIQYISDHGSPRRSELTKLFGYALVDETAKDAVEAGIIDLDENTYTYTMNPSSRPYLKGRIA